MTFRLVGAGLPRTGTSSLRDALAHLLGAPCHHMREVFTHPEQVPSWVSAIEGDLPVWDDLLRGYAVVLLSKRDSAETWRASFEPTVLDRMREVLAGSDPEVPTTPMARLFSVMLRDVIPDPLGPVDAEGLRTGYERRLAEVRAAIAPERLVEWQPGDGWEPLCRALAVPVPDRPFPHENARSHFLARTAERRGEQVPGT